MKNACIRGKTCTKASTGPNGTQMQRQAKKKKQKVRPLPHERKDTSPSKLI